MHQMSDWYGRTKKAILASSKFFSGRPASVRSRVSRRAFAFEPLEPRLTLAAAGLVPVGVQPTGPLTGKIVYTSGGHGWDWNSSLNRWATDRPEYQLVEDFGNQEQMSYYIDYLFRAGATVVPMRPVGRQINEVVVDNDLTSVTYTGAWSDSTTGARWYDEDYGAVADSVRYRFANVNSSSETATATYTPNIAAAGQFPVYTWVSPGTNRTLQTYEINHSGGQTQVKVDHRMVGNGWVYLGTYHFNAGSSAANGSVQISNFSTGGGSVVIADAIRFGNGMGDLPDGDGGIGTGTISGYPREDENSEHWLYRGFGQGASPSTVFSGNVSAPSDMAEYMNQNANPFGTSVYVGFHSNGTTGNPDTASARGAVGLITSSGATPHQADLALYLGRQINQDGQALNGVFEHNWSTRTTHTFTSGFGEIDLGADAEMDATIIEVGFHDNIQDGALLRDPKVRDQLARSVYQGTLEYFDNWGGLPSPTSLPTAPTIVHVVSNSSGQVTINWAAGAATPAAVHGAAATGFRIYASSDGYGFDGGTTVAGGGTTSATLGGYDPTLPYYFKVVATNAGGESHESEVVTVLPSGGVKQVLVVNGFDRLDRFQDFDYPYAYTGDGVVDRAWSRYNNSFDYVVQIHSAIAASKPGVHVASTSNEAVISGAVNLNDYDTVIWILGTESEANDTLNATEQTKVANFINAGGNLFISGSEIAFDLDQQNNGRSFFETTLKGNFVSNSAGTNTATADAGGIFAGMSSFAFSTGNAFSSLDSQTYKVDSADVIAGQAGAVTALSYNNGAGPAAIQVQGTGGAGSIVMFGFPFEAMTSAARRQTAMGRILDFFGVAAPAPAFDIKTRVNGQEADSPTGPILAAGGTASFTYILTNAGNVPLSSITVTDNNGTPVNAADDFNASYTSGDANGNSQLDVGESWTYSAARAVVAGQYSNIGTATATGNAQPVMDTDPGNYFGSAPSVALRSFIVNNDADLPPGIGLEAGSTMVVAYLLTNTGNVALQSIVLSDDNGTPGLTTDDVSPDYLAGDANNDGKLDLGEAWMFIARIPVLAGQHTHIAGVMATDSISQVATASNPNNYVGIVSGNADFNGDTTVNNSDYVVWRNNAGMTSGAAQSQGDANGDGAVDNTDYGIWRSQLGTSHSAGGSTVAASASAAAFAISAFGAAPEVLETSSAAPSDEARATSSVHSAAFEAFAIEQPERRFIRHAAIPRESPVSVRSGGELKSLLNVATRPATQDAAAAEERERIARSVFESSDVCDAKARLASTLGRTLSKTKAVVILGPSIGPVFGQTIDLPALRRSGFFGSRSTD
jgi:hypothetical protein